MKLSFPAIKLSHKLIFCISCVFVLTTGSNAQASNIEFNGQSLSKEAQERAFGAVRAAYEARKSPQFTKTNNKLSGRLQKFSVDLKEPNASIAADPMLRVKGTGSVQVYIKLVDINNGTRTQLENSGVSVDLINEELKIAQGWVDTDDLTTLSEQSWVEYIKEPSYGRTRVGSRQTEGDAILRSNILRERGITGRGIKIGIISDGANNFQQAVASGDLPSNVQLFGTCSVAVVGGTCNEGTAMAEIIHDIAPDAELAVGAGIGSSLEFIAVLNSLANEFQADVIVDDLGFFAEPYFEDGDIAQAVTNLREDILYFSAAGNDNGTHYEGNFSSGTGANLDLHDFDAGGAENIFQGFLVGAGQTGLVILQWNDPFANASTDLDLFVVDINGDIVGSSQDTGPNPIESVLVSNSGATSTFFSVVFRFSGANPRIEMFNLGTGDLAFPVASDAIFGHPGVPRAIAVAAINAVDPGNNDAEPFSSRGPSTVFRPQFQIRQKPDIAAIDGVSVTGTGGFPSTFFGTSAAAPHAAAVAALLLSTGPMVTPDDVRAALTNTAIGGFNNELGFGLINAELALAELAIGNPLPAIFLLLLEEDE